MSPIYVINALVTTVTAGAVFAVWLANRRRIAAETVERDVLMGEGAGHSDRVAGRHEVRKR